MKLKIPMLIILVVILLTTAGAVSASMEIQKVKISTGSELEDKTYAEVYVGAKHSGDEVTIQIYYSRDGSLLNNGNMVPNHVDNGGYIKVASADSYRYYPDKAEINLYDSNGNLLDSATVYLEITSGTQTFGVNDLDRNGDHTSSSHSSSSSSSSSSGGGSTTTYNSGTSDSYVGNSNSGKFHAPGCGDVNKMKPSNKVYFSSRDEAINSGYTPCGHCHP